MDGFEFTSAAYHIYEKFENVPFEIKSLSLSYPSFDQMPHIIIPWNFCFIASCQRCFSRTLFSLFLFCFSHCLINRLKHAHHVLSSLAAFCHNIFSAFISDYVLTILCWLIDIFFSLCRWIIFLVLFNNFDFMIFISILFLFVFYIFFAQFMLLLWCLTSLYTHTHTNTHKAYTQQANLWHMLIITINYIEDFSRAIITIIGWL